MHSNLVEGLRPLDLKEMVNSVFSIDTFKSKMGEDKDIVVLSLTIKDRFPAKDIMEFIEKGYGFVLDADVSAGENNKGEYNVFVELARSPAVIENINELVYGIKKLTGLDNFDFKYHKTDKVYSLTSESIRSIVPLTPRAYEQYLNEVKTESVKHFFNKTLMDDLKINGDIITIYKPFNQSIQLKMVKEGDSHSILENVEDTLTIDTVSTSEVFWLTKVLGNYDINKFGDKFLFTNGDKAMFLQRIE